MTPYDSRLRFQKARDLIMSWKCDHAKCPWTGETRSAFYKHRRKHDPSKKKTCPTCGKVETCTSDYRRHLKSHTAKTADFICSCGKCYTSNQALLKHFKNKEVNFTHQCSRIYMSNVNSNRHKKQMELRSTFALRMKERTKESLGLLIPEDHGPYLRTTMWTKRYIASSKFCISH